MRNVTATSSKRNFRLKFWPFHPEKWMMTQQSTLVYVQNTPPNKSASSYKTSLPADPTKLRGRVGRSSAISYPFLQCFSAGRHGTVCCLLSTYKIAHCIASNGHIWREASKSTHELLCVPGRHGEAAELYATLTGGSIARNLGSGFELDLF